MTRRERLERKLAKRLEWAAGRDKQSAAGFEAARRVADHIPFGQPILVGHHSEKRHRKDLKRIDNGMRKGVESANMAAHHRSAADGIERALDTSIFSDDPDAVETLMERIIALEAKREVMKLVNKLYKKGDAAGLAAIGLDLQLIKDKLTEAGPYWGSAPHLPYELSNLGGNLSRLKDRVKHITARQARTAEAEAAPNGVTVRYSKGYDFTARVDNPTMYASVTFAEKPERAILNDLRAAGFHWGAGYWSGETAKLPESVKVLLEPGTLPAS